MTHGLSSPGELDQGVAGKGAAYAQAWSRREEIKHKMGEGNPLPILPQPGDRGKQYFSYFFCSFNSPGYLLYNSAQF